MTELESYIESYFKVNSDVIKVISSFFKVTKLDKGDFFLKSGKICDKLSSQKSGIIRYFTEDSEGEEITQWISTKGFFVAELGGLIFDHRSKSSIQALSECELYTIHKNDYHQLGKLLPRWNELEKLFIAHCFIFLQERLLRQISLSAEERYRLFFKEQPELFNQVPLQYLASMLGMTPETLSRLRKRVE